MRYSLQISMSVPSQMEVVITSALMRTVPTCAPVERGSHYKLIMAAVMVGFGWTFGWTFIMSLFVDINECALSFCDYDCTNLEGSYQCSCRDGYILGVDGTSCVDYDECSSMPCGYSCVNEPGGYRCVCRDGYNLDTDETSCNGTSNSTIH